MYCANCGYAQSSYVGGTCPSGGTKWASTSLDPEYVPIKRDIDKQLDQYDKNNGGPSRSITMCLPALG